MGNETIKAMKGRGRVNANLRSLGWREPFIGIKEPLMVLGQQGDR